MDKINWDWLSRNPNAIHLLKQNMNRINWVCLSQNPNAIHLLKQNMDKINWHSLSQNPNAIHFYWKLKYTKIFEITIPITFYYINLRKYLLKELCIYILEFIRL